MLRYVCLALCVALAAATGGAFTGGYNSYGYGGGNLGFNSGYYGINSIGLGSGFKGGLIGGVAPIRTATVISSAPAFYQPSYKQQAFVAAPTAFIQQAPIFSNVGSYKGAGFGGIAARPIISNNVGIY